MKARTPSTIKRVFAAQLGVTIILAVALVVVHGGVAAYSALLGGTIYTIANTYASWRVFSRKNCDSAHGELFNLYRAEFGKLVMIGSLCAATFAALDSINVIAFVGGCLGAMIAGTVSISGQTVDKSGSIQNGKT